MQKTTLVMLASQILALLGFAAYPVALIAVQNEWGLSNFESGLIASSFFLGYVLIVPFASSLSDRLDAKRIYLVGGFLSACGLMSFGLLANELFQACLCMLINGAGFASLYMPGLKIITDRLEAKVLSRPIAFYTAFFGVGTGFSYLLAGFLMPYWGWRDVFVVVSMGPLASLLLVYFLINDCFYPKVKKVVFLSDIFPIEKWREVLKNKQAASFILGYGIHCLELFASRNWIVAYFVFCGSHGQAQLPISMAVLAGLINFVGVPSSIIGNDIAHRMGRMRWVVLVMLLSSIFAVGLSLVYQQAWWLILTFAVLHMILIMADSSALTGGLVLSAKNEVKGAAMGLHSLTGFVGGLAGPALFGYALDASQKSELSYPWTCAFLSIVTLSLVFSVTQFRSAFGPNPVDKNPAQVL
jgi:MFS family permease